MVSTEVKTSLKSHLGEYIHMTLTPSPKAGKEHYCCPFCGSGTRSGGTGAFTYYADSQIYKCFSCGATGSLVDLYAHLNGLNSTTDFKRIISDLMTLFPDSTSDFPVSEQPKEIKSYKRFFSYALHQRHELKISYLDDRGILPQVQDYFKIGYIKDFKAGSDTINVIIIPTSDSSFSYRSTVSGVKGKRGSAWLFGHDFLTSSDFCFITESAIDAMSIMSCGYGDTTGTFSLVACSLESAQNVELLRTIPLSATLILALDNDDTGRAATSKLLELCAERDIKCFVPDTDFLYSGRKDANEALVADSYGFMHRLWKCVGEAEKAGVPVKTADKKKQVEEVVVGQGVDSLPSEKQWLKDYHVFEYLDSKGYSIRYNMISHDIDYNSIDLAVSQSQLFSALPQKVYADLRPYYKGVSKDDIYQYISDYADIHRYNPVLDIIHSARWDSSDQLYNLFCALGLTDSTSEDVRYSRIFVCKWLMQCYAGLYNDNIDSSFSLDLILVLQGDQGCGKTRFFRELALNPTFFGEGMCLDPKNKDLIIMATSHWITELGELEQTTRGDMEAIKAFTTVAYDTYRSPYGKVYQRYPRVTSFAGTVNGEEFLSDPTGNRRFLTISIPHGFKIDLSEVDVLQLWLQISDIVKHSGKGYAECFRLTDSELAYLCKRNKTHTQLRRGEQELLDVLERNSVPKQNYICEMKEFTVTEYLRENFIDSRIDSRVAGKILRELGYSSRRTMYSRLYMLPVQTFVGG